MKASTALSPFKEEYRDPEEMSDSALIREILSLDSSERVTTPAGNSLSRNKLVALLLKLREKREAENVQNISARLTSIQDLIGTSPGVFTSRSAPAFGSSLNATARSTGMAYWKKYLILLTPFVVPFLLSGSLERLIAFLIIFLILPLCCMSGRSKVAFQTFPTTSDAARVALSEARIQAKPSFKQAVAHLERFIVYCKERSLEMGFEAVACFLTNFMKENKDHTASLSNVASHLRTQHDLNDLPWLTAKEEKRLKKLFAQYRLEDTTPVNRKSPLRTKIVTRAIDKWNLDNVWELQWATLLLVAVQVLL